MTLVERLRDEVGLTMGTVYSHSYVGWTTDGFKVRASQELDARILIRPYVSLIEPACSGWEVICPRDDAS